MHDFHLSVSIRTPCPPTHTCMYISHMYVCVCVRVHACVRACVYIYACGAVCVRDSKQVTKSNLLNHIKILVHIGPMMTAKHEVQGFDLPKSLWTWDPWKR